MWDARVPSQGRLCARPSALPTVLSIIALAIQLSSCASLTLSSCPPTFHPQIQTRIANEKYLRTHKEVDLLISGFFR